MLPLNAKIYLSYYSKKSSFICALSYLQWVQKILSQFNVLRIIVYHSKEIKQLQFLHTKKNINNNPVVLARERTIPTERKPLVGEVSANFLG
jgi:hypothetical protein